MRYIQAEKIVFIRTVESSELSVRKTLEELDINRGTFYEWHRRYREYGYDGLTGRKSSPKKFWNKIPDQIREQVVEIALEYPEKSPRELAWHITDTREYFISKSSIYGTLKACDLITSPAYVLIRASDKFKNPTTRINELWQTDFTYFMVVD